VKEVNHGVKNYGVILVLLIVACLHDILFEKIFILYHVYMGTPPKDYGIATNILAGIIIAPLFETVIFQYIPHKGLKYIKILKNKKVFDWVYILISGTLFCLSHWYSIIYIIVTIIPGLLLAFYFNWYYNKFNYCTAIYYISLLHLLKNSVALIDKYLL
jgi:uncharacterized protein